MSRSRVRIIVAVMLVLGSWSADPGFAQGPGGQAPAGPPPGVPARPGASAAFDQRPGAELRGLTRLGLVVEDLGAQAAACGLRRDAIETALTKTLTDAGFRVVRNADEDTYLYVNVGTGTLPGGSCVTRYDAFLYTNTTAALEYHAAPVLVQVQLLHKGGLATGGAAAPHGQGVIDGLREYVSQFAGQIRDANK